MNLNPTYWGTCKGKTKKGQLCRHTVIFANGFCKQHGGATPPEYAKELLERERARLLMVAERFNKRIDRWRRESKNSSGGDSKTISLTEPAKASTDEESAAAVKTFT